MNRLLSFFMASSLITGSLLTPVTLLSKGENSHSEKKKQEEAQRKHIFFERGLLAFLFCDTSNPKTKQFHLQDLKTVQNTLQSIAKQCNAPLEIHIFKEKRIDYDRLKALTWDKHQFKEGRCFFIYYTGDEVQTANKQGEWPCLNFISKKSHTLFNQKEITETSMPYQASWNYISLFDCYNDTVKIRGKKKPFPAISPKMKSKGNDLEYLFHKPRGSLLTSGKKRNTPSYGIQRGKLKGGLFTLMLCQKLRNLGNSQYIWQDLLQEIEQDCQNYMINLSKTPPCFRYNFSDLINPDDPWIFKIKG